MEEKRAEILATAKEILIAHGKHTKMSDIAACLDLETSSLYYYYKGIPEILNALLADKYRDLNAYEDHISTPGKTHFELLHEMLVYLMGFYHENLDLVQIVLTQVFPLFHAVELEDESAAINDYLMAYWKANDILLYHIRGAQEVRDLAPEIPPNQILQILRGAMWGVIASWREYPTEKSNITYCVDRILRTVTN
jgi:AcrR family transcriptional regulator